MKTSTASYYLQAMGITEWRLRPLIEENLYPIYCYNLHHYGILVASAGIDATQRDSERVLLSAIVKALGGGDEEKMKTNLAQIKLPSKTQIIFLGQDCAEQFIKLRKIPANFPLLKTHSLEAMLSNPLLKGEVWRMLCALR